MEGRNPKPMPAADPAHDASSLDLAALVRELGKAEYIDEAAAQPGGGAPMCAQGCFLRDWQGAARDDRRLLHALYPHLQSHPRLGAGDHGVFQPGAPLHPLIHTSSRAEFMAVFWRFVHGTPHVDRS